MPTPYGPTGNAQKKRKPQPKPKGQNRTLTMETGFPNAWNIDPMLSNSDNGNNEEVENYPPLQNQRTTRKIHLIQLAK